MPSEYHVEILRRAARTGPRPIRKLIRRLTFEKPACYFSQMGSDDDSVFELTVPSRMEALDSVRQLVERASHAFELDEELAHWIELAVNESAINAIQHGNCSDPAKQVFLRISSNGRTLEVIVEDEGAGFDLKSIPDPTDVANLLKPGGRGILIIQTFMDKVEVTSLARGGSRLRMVKNLQDGSVT